MKNVNGLGEALTGLLFPRRCPVCHMIVDRKDGTACRGCRQKLTPVKEPLCKKCGKPLLSETEEFCCDCGRGRHYYEEGRAVYIYEKEMKKAVQQLKYYNKREYADFFAEEMEKALSDRIRRWAPDVVIGVPMYWRKKQKRGYNQAEVMAKKLAGRLCIPYRKNLVKKIKNTDSQKNLGMGERKKNLKNAFKIKESDVKLDVVLIVDDVYTTGSTIDAVAKVLKEHGVKRVYFISFCIGRGTS